MSIPPVVNNAGKLFNEDALNKIDKYVALSDEDLQSMLDQIREHYDRRRGQLGENDTGDHMSFFFLNRTLHLLGFTHSHNEPLPNETGKVDYTLFESPEDFLAHANGRATSQLFSGALALAKTVGWETDLDGGKPDEATPDHPAFELDDLLRQTGLHWAILTSGSKWRMYHRNTAAMLNTFYEVDLKTVIEENDLEGFKYFAMIFTKYGLIPDKSGRCVARNLLA